MAANAALKKNIMARKATGKYDIQSKDTPKRTFVVLYSEHASHFPNRMVDTSACG
jgi:hypothetical protein